MAEDIFVAGKTQVKTNSSVIGSTDDGNDIRIKVFRGHKKVHTNLSGPELWEYIINLGLRAVITVPFQKIDEAVLAPLIASPASVEGQCGTLGLSIPSFPLSIVPANGSGYYFANAWVLDNYEINKFGYEPKMIMVTFEATANPSINGSGTAPLYTRS